VYRGSNEFDYGVERFASAVPETRGFTANANPSFEERRQDGTYRTTVVVRRFGEAFFPVDVLTKFENGEEAREKWDGRDRWRVYTYDRPSRATSAEVDPDRVLLLDVNYTNNSRTLAPRADMAGAKWSLAWMVWFQDLLLTWAFFV
jgi:hypothetical protein